MGLGHSALLAWFCKGYAKIFYFITELLLETTFKTSILPSTHNQLRKSLQVQETTNSFEPYLTLSYKLLQLSTKKIQRCLPFDPPSFGLPQRLVAEPPPPLSLDKQFELSQPLHKPMTTRLSTRRKFLPPSSNLVSFNHHSPTPKLHAGFNTSYSFDPPINHFFSNTFSGCQSNTDFWMS